MRKSRNFENEEQRRLRLEAEAMAFAEELAREHQDQFERMLEEEKPEARTSKKKKS
jgi:hypothetical protein